MGGRWWTKKNKENMIGKRGTKLIVFFLLFRGGVQPFFFYIKIVLPPQGDQINRGRFFNPVLSLISTHHREKNVLMQDGLVCPIKGTMEKPGLKAGVFCCFP